MDKKVYELINDQINKELYSGYLYLSFADYYEAEGLKGFANWYMIQAQEERDHALIFRKYLLDNDCPVVLGAIDKPDKAFTDYLAPLEAAYVGGRMPALEANDFRTQQFLHWFIDEQLEEEANASEMVSNMKLFGTDARSLYELDREYQGRAYSVPSPLAGE